jgi:hypothetical protein
MGIGLEVIIASPGKIRLVAPRLPRTRRIPPFEFERSNDGRTSFHLGQARAELGIQPRIVLLTRRSSEGPDAGKHNTKKRDRKHNANAAHGEA